MAVGGGSAIDSSKAIREFALKDQPLCRSGADRNSNNKRDRIRSNFFCSCQRYRGKSKISACFRQPDSRRGDSGCRAGKSVPPSITADTWEWMI